MKALLFVIILVVFSLSVFAQTPTPIPLETADEVVKISTNLVQVDAVVTDKKGNQITDLTADDIELLQDGKTQKITAFSYVNTETRKTGKSAVNLKTDKNAIAAPPSVPLRSGQLGRVLTFIVDDGNCVVSISGMRAAREGLEKFVNEQMQPNDLIAIYQTRSGSSLLQQYTSDKTRLLNVIRKIRWYPPGGICSITGDAHPQARNDSTLKSEGTQTFESNETRQRNEAADNFNRDKASAGTIGVLRYAINGLRRIGGRKILFLLSDSLPISNGRNNLFNSFYEVKDLMELANRAAVVVNSVDVRGMDVAGAQAVDDFGIKSDMMAVEKIMTSRQLGNDSRQSGLFYAASETGGKFYQNINNIDHAIQEALKLEKGYYLIGYQPEEETFKGKKFHKIEIKLKRPDLTVSSRSGFTSLTDKEIKPKQRTGDSELYDALIAPLPNDGLDIRMTAFFANTASEGSFVKTLLHLGGNSLSFTDEPNGMKKAVFDVIAVTLNEKNEVIDEFNRTHTIRFPGANLAQVRQNGLIYTADVPVKKAGVYNFRIAVRDVSSKLLGSAGQQIEVPNLKKSKVFLSELTLGEVTIKDGKPILPSLEKSEDAFSTVQAVSNLAIRRFYPGAILGYSYKIYSAQVEKTAQKPNLTLQVRLYFDGQLISDNAAQPIELQPQTEAININDYGYMRLPAGIAPGDYALQIIVKDLQANETTSQWIDFEIIQ